MGSYYLSDTAEDQLFVSEGEFSEFIDLWLNGVKLQSGDDYTAVEGSTSITLSSKLLQTLETDSKNTIVAEFREGGTLDGALICTAQNFTITEANVDAPDAVYIDPINTTIPVGMMVGQSTAIVDGVYNQRFVEKISADRLENASRITFTVTNGEKTAEYT